MRKKFIAIGDIHGRNFWKKINPELYDKIIFVGDYVDGPLSDAEIVTNLRDIIEFKSRYPDKVILLVGNHDIQYLLWQPWNEYECSGFRAHLQPLLTKMFNLNLEYFQAAYQIDNILFTHAGVSNGWYNYCKEIIDEYQQKFQTENLAETFNVIFRSKDTKILHLVGTARRGYFPYGGITWADKNETINNPLWDYHQVVGHTNVRYIDTYSINDTTKITYIDVLSAKEDYYVYPVDFEI